MSTTQLQKPHVVIVGGGFGGISAAQALKKADVRVTIIDRRNHHLFQPLLYQVAMAGLSPAEIAYPIRSIFRNQKNVDVMLEEVTSIDLKQKLVKFADGGELGYDYLIMATGAQTGYFGKTEWEKHTVGLKDLDDATEIRRRVLLAFEAAERERQHNPELLKQLLTFVVIGGGATGVELAGSLAELARFVLATDFRHITPGSARVILLEGAPQILGAYTKDLSDKAVDQLKHLGVEVRTGTMVKNIDKQGVHLDGELIATSTVLWCAGVTATPLTKTLGVNCDRAGRVLVQEDLSVPEHPEAFVIGDACTFLHQDGKPLPGLAPVAMQQGTAAAKSIKDTLAGRARKKFFYKHKGSMATIGRNAAVADFNGWKFSGYLAWLSWLFIHIFFIIGFRNRLVVMFDWMWSYLTYQRGARLITGRRLEPGTPVEEPNTPEPAQPPNKS
jgi:NADH:ubiquinone reductase (H+-translocating)